MKLERVLITGTTTGVGLALLAYFAARGANIVCVNRRRVPELESQYPSVRFECVDVRSGGEVADLMRRLTEGAALPDLFILNAGINRVDNDASFQLADFQAVLDTNLYGVLNFVSPLTRLPATRMPRHVIAVSSMASYVGNPYGLGYHASKRALSACFDAWSKMYIGTDLVFQQVMLGPVHTAMYTMAESLPAWMVWIKDAFSVSPEATARAIARFAGSRRKKLFYPWKAVPLYGVMWIGQSLIPGFFRGQRTLDGSARREAAQQRTDANE